MEIWRCGVMSNSHKGFVILLALVLAFAVAGCNSDDDGNNPPVAQPSITGITPATVSLGQRDVEGRIQGLNLTGVVSVNLGASISVQQAQSVSASEIAVVFTVGRDAQPGARSISVVTSGGTASSAAIFTLLNNQVPNAQFTVDPASIGKNSTATFDASKTTDTDGTVTNYGWNFGDGQTANGKIATHKFAQAGTYQVRLNVTDNRGGTNFSSRSLEVTNNQGPVAKFTVTPAQGDLETTFTFDGSQSKDNDGRVVKHSWNFGDGGKAEGQVVKHTFHTRNFYTVRLTVTDNQNATSEAEKEVSVGLGTDCRDQSTLSGQNGCGGFVGQLVCLHSVKGNIAVTSEEVRICRGLCGEFRRDAEGVREFVGDIIKIDGTTVTLEYGNLPVGTRPKAGEKVRAIWRPKHGPGQKNCF
jgi:PKD repeat protein